MSSCPKTLTDSVKRLVSAFAISCIATCVVTDVAAGGNFNGRQSQVGGVAITAEGVLKQPNMQGKSQFLESLRKNYSQPAADLATPVAVRKISLKKLNAVLEDAAKNKRGELPDEVKYLAGLQRIEYVFVYPEQNDIVLAGPGEGWTINNNGAVVGITTGQPVIMLDDLLTAFRSVHNARTQGITCSIDPTEEGYQNLNRLLQSRQVRSGRVNQRALETQMKQAFGPQQITVGGVPTDSHFARVLVSADYRMKRLAMNLEQSPVKQVSSYLHLTKSAQSANTNPRWWLACNYEPLARSNNRLSWQLKGPGVKVMTDEEFVNEGGAVGNARTKNSAAQKWADQMTDNYGQLAEKIEVFGQLRNLMDMCVIAALIEKEGLSDLAASSLPMIQSGQNGFPQEQWHAAKTVDPEVSFLRTRGGVHVTASGGVEITSWQVASKSAVDAKVADARTAATAKSDTWWWN